MKDRAVYEERTGWPWWVHPLILLTLIAAVIPLWEFSKGNIGNGPDDMPLWGAALMFAIGVGLPVSIYSLMGQLRTRIMSEGIDIRWGFLEIIKKTIPFSQIQKAEAVTYSPIGEFGGWGIRVGAKKKKAWTIGGNRALVLHLTDGTRFYLGSEKPERMLQWITSAAKRSEE
ncbi:MAG: hypothetical protein HKO65_00395 [Gemmatimonadetes bacterium]|nr:hypothetical protein [Gemmatimonadota bacterium]NNM03532.1 hypothetical protein [Gemmatimonadota bacterium]